jgi:hypothetical protein
MYIYSIQFEALSQPEAGIVRVGGEAGWEIGGKRMTDRAGSEWREVKEINDKEKGRKGVGRKGTGGVPLTSACSTCQREKV